MKSIPENSIKTAGLIEIDKIEVPEFISVFSYPQKDEKLIGSVKNIGIVNPVLTAKSDNRYLLICGVKRLAAVKELNFKQIPAYIILDGEYKKDQIFDIAFFDNISGRKFNLIEIAGIFSVLKDMGTDRSEIAKKYLSEVDLPGGFKTLDFLPKIFSLKEELKAFIVKWNLSPGNLVYLLKFDPVDRQDIFEVIRTLQIHGGKLRQFSELVFEICRRDAISVKDLLNMPFLQSLLNETKITSSQKQSKIIDWLNSLRKPELTKREREFSAIESSLKGLNAGVFSAPREFEGENIRANLNFKNLKELDSFCEAVQNESNRKKIQSLLNLL
ncbi:ParB/RepB/Spo0J family partition protein [candidate division KSB1 bacterium]